MAYNKKTWQVNGDMNAQQMNDMENRINGGFDSLISTGITSIKKINRGWSGVEKTDGNGFAFLSDQINTEWVGNARLGAISGQTNIDLANFSINLFRNDGGAIYAKVYNNTNNAPLRNTDVSIFYMIIYI